jgi:hypothetical protein
MQIPNEFEKKLNVAITNQDVKTQRLLLLRQNEFNIDRDFVRLHEDSPCQPLRYRHLNRHSWPPVIPSPKITHMLILAGADVNYHLINKACNALLDALPNHNGQIPEDMNITEWDGNFSKCELGARYDNMRLLLDAGAHVDAGGKKWSALHSAACDCDLPAARFLLDHHANVSIMDEWDCSPLYIACCPDTIGLSHLSMIKLLFEYGADPDESCGDHRCGALCAGEGDDFTAVFRAERWARAEAFVFEMHLDAGDVLKTKLEEIKQRELNEADEIDANNEVERFVGELHRQADDVLETMRKEIDQRAVEELNEAGDIDVENEASCSDEDVPSPTRDSN